MDVITRRVFLGGAGSLAAGLVLGTATGCSLGASGPTPSPSHTQIVTDGRWPGHTQGRINLGVSSNRPIEEVEAQTGPLGAVRRFFRWDELDEEIETVRADHVARRLPWVSFKPPSTGPGGWADVVSGRHDEAIRARARRYAELLGPVISTFHHEPHHDETGTPGQFVKAWTYIHDLAEDETGLANCAFVPIIGEWLYNPEGGDKATPRQYISGKVLDRSAFLGIDIYQNRSGAGADERLDRVLAWLDRQGHPDMMIGIGETGATERFGAPAAAQWWNGLWSWAGTHTDRIGAVSYFNSPRNNAEGVEWALAESDEKLAAFRTSVASSVACRLP